MRNPNSTEKYGNFWESTVGAASGLWDAIRTENKVRQVFIIMAAVTAVCFVADVGYFQILMVIFSWVLAFVCEMFNTALEKAVDFACGERFHPLIKQAKDYAAACTFVALIFAGNLSLFVLLDRRI